MDHGDDFPAAHSMDTDWFAVDRDGHVAYFNSGEAGAVPLDACCEDDTAMLDQLETAVPRTEPIYELAPRSGACEEGSHHAPTAADGGPLALDGEPWPILVFVTSLDAVAEDVGQGLAIPVASRGAAAVFFPDMPIATYRRLHESGACLSCFYNDPAYDDLPERLGLYHFKHPDDLYVPEPYGRWGSPRRPLHIDQVPAALAEALTRVRFEGVCFGEAGRIQPVEHAPCVCWMVGGYLTVDGQALRPIPGEEDLFGELEEELAKKHGLRVEPPPH
jgi:hypothetical protein